MSESATASADVKDAPPSNSAEQSNNKSSSQEQPNGTGSAPAATDDASNKTLEMRDGPPDAADPPVTPSGESASAKKDSKRKSVGGGSTIKKNNNRRKSTAVLQLDAKPGDYFWTRMKGYPDWPSVICDEEMIPEPLLLSRPVSAMRPDGTYRDDFADEGKNARERTYPVMFLATNEFMWAKNTDLTPLDPETMHEPTKKTKSLAEAYEIVKQKNPLDFYKKMLYEHQKEIQELEAEFERKEAEKEAKKSKKTDKTEKPAKSAKRKSTAAASAAADEDVEMTEAADEAEEATPSAKGKSNKKRKKDDAAAGEDDESKPAKKISLKVSKANGEPETKSKQKKAKKPEAPKLSAEELRVQKQKQLMYLRHKLQKGFLTRDQPPKEEEMTQMAEFFNNLEAQKDIDAHLLRETKVHKVLKAIVKLTSIPRDEEFKFKERSLKLVQSWQPLLAEDAGGAKPSGKEKANGEKTEDEKEDKDDDEQATKDATEGSAEPTSNAEDDKKEESADKDTKTEDSKTDALPKANGDESASGDKETKTEDAPKEAAKEEGTA